MLVIVVSNVWAIFKLTNRQRCAVHSLTHKRTNTCKGVPCRSKQARGEAWPLSATEMTNVLLIDLLTTSSGTWQLSVPAKEDDVCRLSYSLPTLCAAVCVCACWRLLVSMSALEYVCQCARLFANVRINACMWVYVCLCECVCLRTTCANNGLGHGHISVTIFVLSCVFSVFFFVFFCAH